MLKKTWYPEIFFARFSNSVIFWVVWEFREGRIVQDSGLDDQKYGVFKWEWMKLDKLMDYVFVERKEDIAIFDHTTNYLVLKMSKIIGW